jgi:hypothetical protein
LGGGVSHVDARSAPVLVLAVAETTDHTKRDAGGVDDHDRVHPIGLARAAIIFNRLSRVKCPNGHPRIFARRNRESLIANR